MTNDSRVETRVSEQEPSKQGIAGVAGVDLGDKHSFVCLLDLDGEVLERKKIRTNVAAMERYFSSWPRLRVVFEAGTHANWIYRLTARLGHEPLMADTHRLALITQSQSKDDRSDAERLGELGLRLPALLNAAVPRSLESQTDRAVLKAREALIETRTKLINSLRGTVKSFGYRLPAAGGAAFATKAAAGLPVELTPALGPVLAVIQQVSEQIRGYDREILRLLREKYPHTKRLRSAQGVGPVTALAYVLDLDNDPRRLRASRDAGPRAGLRPKRRDSGERSPELSITKSGDPMLRRLLVQCAQYMLGPFGQDSALRRWGLRLAARGGKAAKRKAVVAVARKLAVILHVLWLRDVDFVPFPAGEPTAAASAA